MSALDAQHPVGGVFDLTYGKVRGPRCRIQPHSLIPDRPFVCVPAFFLSYGVRTALCFLLFHCPFPRSVEANGGKIFLKNAPEPNDCGRLRKPRRDVFQMVLCRRCLLQLADAAFFILLHGIRDLELDSRPFPLEPHSRSRNLPRTSPSFLLEVSPRVCRSEHPGNADL